MATARATANMTVQPLFSTPLHMKAIIDDVDINNQGSSGTIKVQLEDDFTQDVSVGNNTPTARSAFPFEASVPQGTDFSADVNSLADDVECLGDVGVKCDKTDAACSIIVKYHFE